jgi:hypothetical protein
MKYIKLSTILVGIILTAQSASAIEMTDYKLAESFYDDSYVGFTFDLKDGNQEQTSYNGTFTGNYRAKYNSEPYAWDFNFNGNSNFTQSANKAEGSDENYNFMATGNYDKYIIGYDKLFVYGSGELGYRKSSGVDDADDPFVKIGVGIGYGRMYESTPVAKALRITDDLEDYGLIDTLDDETLIKIASIIDRESEFKSKFSIREYKKFWYEAIESELKSSGALKKESLGAFGIVRMDEVLFIERVSPRYHGWLVRAGLGQILSNYDGESTDPTLDFVFEYGLPIGYKAQFYNKTLYSTILADDVGHIFRNHMSYTYEISDRVDWENSWDFIYNKASDDNVNDVTKNNLSSTFRYYLANRLNFFTTLTFTSIEDDVDDNGNDDFETRLNVGLSYRLK